MKLPPGWPSVLPSSRRPRSREPPVEVVPLIAKSSLWCSEIRLRVRISRYWTGVVEDRLQDDPAIVGRPDRPSLPAENRR
jgi:hypothetical protein